jgi:anti-sigma factor RsiW
LYAILPLDEKCSQVDKRPVAALVYQRRQHFINLFIWPSSHADTAPQLSSRQGYHLFEWNQAGMTYWAVSDVSRDDLQALVRLMQQRAILTPVP